MIHYAHFSDLHFKKPDFETKFLRESLEEFLSKKFIEDSRDKLDFILITGDIADKGKVKHDEAKRFVRTLLEITKCDTLYYCIGNHEIEEEEYSGRINSIEKYYDKANNGRTIMLPKTIAEMNHIFPAGHELFKKTYRSLTKQNYGNNPYKLIEAINYNILLLDTCLFYCDSNKELIVCTDKLSDALKNASSKSENKFLIVAGHHTMDSFTKREKYVLTDLFNTYNVDLYMCGHCHEPIFSPIQNSTIYMVSSGQMIDEVPVHQANYTPSFFLGALDPDTSEIKMSLYQYDSRLPEKWEDCTHKGILPLLTKNKGTIKIDRLKKNKKRYNP